MPYKTVGDLPSNVKQKYDAKGQRAFLKAFNSCWDKHEDEGRCFAYGYNAANMSKSKTDRGKKKGSLRSSLIRLAHSRPDLRPKLLPILKQGFKRMTGQTNGHAQLKFTVTDVQLDKRNKTGPAGGIPFVFKGTASVFLSFWAATNTPFSTFKWVASGYYHPDFDTYTEWGWMDLYDHGKLVVQDAVGKMFETQLWLVLRSHYGNVDRDNYLEMAKVLKELYDAQK